ncbi:unnamed protein product, partial [Dibothriocephalus latus]
SIFDYHERHARFIPPDKSVDSYNLPDTNNSAAIETPREPEGSTDISVLDRALQMKLAEVTGKLKDIWPDTYPTEKFACSNNNIVTVKQFIALSTTFLGSATAANCDNKWMLVQKDTLRQSYEETKAMQKEAIELTAFMAEEFAPWVALESPSLFLYGDALLDRAAFHRILRTMRNGLNEETRTHNQNNTDYYEDFRKCLLNVKLEASVCKSLREKWISELQKVSASPDATIEDVYRKTFETLQKDQDRNGTGGTVKVCVYLREHDTSEVSCFAAFPETVAEAVIGTTIAVNTEAPVALALRERRPALGLAAEGSTLVLPLVTPNGRTYGALQIETSARGFVDSADFKFYLWRCQVERTKIEIGNRERLNILHLSATCQVLEGGTLHRSPVLMYARAIRKPHYELATCGRR